VHSRERKRDLAANIVGRENRGLPSRILHVLLCGVLAACGGRREDTAAPIADPVGWRREMALAGVDTSVHTAVGGGTRTPCDTAPHGPPSYREVRNGRLRIEVPPAWEPDRSWEYGVVFRVPALTDARVDRAETLVSVILAVAGPGVAERTREDERARGRRPENHVLFDTVPDPDYHYSWWRMDRKEVTMSMFDDNGQAGGPVVRVLFITALLKDKPRSAYEAYSRDTGHLLSTLTVDGRRIFPGGALHPVVECYAPAGTAP